MLMRPFFGSDTNVFTKWKFYFVRESFQAMCVRRMHSSPTISYLTDYPTTRSQIHYQ